MSSMIRLFPTYRVQYHGNSFKSNKGNGESCRKNFNFYNLMSRKFNQDRSFKNLFLALFA